MLVVTVEGSGLAKSHGELAGLDSVLFSIALRSWQAVPLCS